MPLDIKEMDRLVTSFAKLTLARMPEAPGFENTFFAPIDQVLKAITQFTDRPVEIIINADHENKKLGLTWRAASVGDSEETIKEVEEANRANNLELERDALKQSIGWMEQTARKHGWSEKGGIPPWLYLENEINLAREGKAHPPLGTNVPDTVMCPECGEPCKGTLEIIPGLAQAEPAADGVGIEYTGQTDVHWDGQKTELVDGLATLICSKGHEWLVRPETLENTERKDYMAGKGAHGPEDPT